MRLITRFKALAQQETPAERHGRMLPGAFYGMIIASAYAIVGSIINQLSFPDIPVGVDWHTLFPAWIFLTVWLGLGGAFINWFTQTEESIAPGLFVMVVSALGAGALTFENDLPTQIGKLALLALPVLGISLLMTILLRHLGVRHAELLEQERRVRDSDLS